MSNNYDSDTESDDESLNLLRNYKVVIRKRKVKQLAQDLAKQLGEDMVPEEMKQNNELEGVIISYDEKSKKFQVEVESVGITFSLERQDFILQEDREKLKNLKF